MATKRGKEPEVKTHKSMSQLFSEREKNIRQRGRAVGLTTSHICKASGVARATPDRWREKPPLSVELLDKMEAVVIEAEKAAAAKQSIQ